MTRRHIQAKDIPDAMMLRAVEVDRSERNGLPACLYTMQDRMTAFPRKVISAKLRSLAKRGLIDGCPCGCRGDYQLTAAGHEALAAAPPHTYPGLQDFQP